MSQGLRRKQACLCVLTTSLSPAATCAGTGTHRARNPPRRTEAAPADKHARLRRRTPSSILPESLGALGEAS